MKIDKGNLRHWLYLVRLGLNTLAAVALRPFRRRGRRAIVVFYGHKLNGNLLALYRYLRDAPGYALPQPVFLSLDPGYAEQLQREGEACVSAIAPACAALLARCDAIVTSHGLHAMQPLVRLSDIRFFDVWHGIPYKGFDADDFRVQHRYDEAWVASELHRRLYLERYGFLPQRVVATGYPRTDRLVTRHEDEAALRARLGVPSGRTILFAPTWAQDDKGRSLYPFGHDEATFLGALTALAERLDATVLMRAHLNSGAGAARSHPRVLALPAGEFPDAEAVLLASDVLVCDWSSIAFDYLLLDRPTIFLDVPSPFRKGFSLGPEYRFGPVVGSLEAMLQELDTAVRSPGVYRARHAAQHEEIRGLVYEEFADGHATRRCVERMAGHLQP